MDAPAIDDSALIRVHHFVGTALAQRNLQQTLRDAEAELGPQGKWFAGEVITSFGYVLDTEIPLVREDRTPTKPSDEEFLQLCNKYYDPSIEKPDHKQVDLQYGFKSCGLPLILEHNTPNNSITLLWKESEGCGSANAMYSLFRRRERH